VKWLIVPVFTQTPNDLRLPAGGLLLNRHEHIFETCSTLFRFRVHNCAFFFSIPLPNVVQSQHCINIGPIHTNDALRFSVLHPGPAQPRPRHDGASFIGQQSIRTRQILLEFVSAKNEPIYVTRLRISYLPGKAIVIRIFLSTFLQTWQE
jgi:hypothetical protein